LQNGAAKRLQFASSGEPKHCKGSFSCGAGAQEGAPIAPDVASICLWQVATLLGMWLLMVMRWQLLLLQRRRLVAMSLVQHRVVPP